MTLEHLSNKAANDPIYPNDKYSYAENQAVSYEQEN
jgi:hypothetical protein